MLRVYRALFLAEIQAAAQYRVQGLLWLLLAVVRPVIFLAAWTAVAQAQGGVVSGFTPGDFAAYYLTLALVMQLTQAWNVWDFEVEVRQGKLSPKLLRPLHPIHYAVVENVAYKLFPLLVLLPILVVLAWLFEARFATHAWHAALFLPSVLLAAALRFVFGWVIASLAFWLTRVQAVTTLSDRATFILGGQIAPLDLLVGPLQALAYLLPFGYMLGVPAEILRGGVAEPEQALLLLAGQMSWLSICYVAWRLVWRAGLRAYSAVGA